MTTLKDDLGAVAVTKVVQGNTEVEQPVPAFSYLEISDNPLLKANLYYACEHGVGAGENQQRFGPDLNFFQ